MDYIDSEVMHDLNLGEFNWERDYVCYRYVDDYFFFYNEDKCKEKALALFEGYMKEYKFSIGNEKTKLFERPFITDITRVKIRREKHH